MIAMFSPSYRFIPCSAGSFCFALLELFSAMYSVATLILSTYYDSTLIFESLLITVILPKFLKWRVLCKGNWMDAGQQMAILLCKIPSNLSINIVLLSCMANTVSSTLPGYEAVQSLIGTLIAIGCKMASLTGGLGDPQKCHWPCSWGGHAQQHYQSCWSCKNLKSHYVHQLHCDTRSFVTPLFIQFLATMSLYPHQLGRGPS